MRILILYCEEGEGHASVARTLAAELDSLGIETTVHDALNSGLGRVIPFFSRDAYRVQVRRLRWTYGLEFLFFTRFPPTRAFARAGLAFLGGRPLRRLVGRVQPSVIVSTHPAVTNVLGALRRRGRLEIPVVATVTDFGVHSLWAHRGVDRHLVMHERSVEPIERVAGSGSARVVEPIVAPGFRSNGGQREARRILGLPCDGAVAVISGGGWAVGDIELAVDAALAVEGLTVIVLAARNEVLRRRLEERLNGRERVHVLPFTTKMPELLAAADVLVDTSLGVTCLEALSAGCRVIAFGAPPGHSRDNARALAALGLAERPRTSRKLTALLEEVAREPTRVPGLLPSAQDPTAAILSAQARVGPAKSRRPALVAGAATLATLAFTGWTFASPTPYPLVARALDLGGLQSVQTSRPDVALVVDAPLNRIATLAQRLARRGMQGSFAVSSRPSGELMQTLAHDGDTVLPATSPGGPAGLLGFRRRLLALAHAVGNRGRFYYLRPRSGFTLADYLAAREAGGVPVTASVTFDSAAAPSLDDLQPGAIVVVDASRAQARDSLTAALALLASRDLRPVPLDALLASASRA